MHVRQDAAGRLLPGLTDYVKTQMSEYQIICDWKIDLNSFRLYFQQAHKKSHIVQVSQEALDESRPGEMEAKLERSKLEALFVQHPDEIIVFGLFGLSFLPLP
jgi:hypothetical protein